MHGSADIAGVNAEFLAAEFGTPLYVYDGDAIIARSRRVAESILHRPLKVFYSAKANPAVAVAALLRRAGVGLDACSPGDLALADAAGFSNDEISYTGFGATARELADAVRRCSTVVVDSVEDIELVARVPGVRGIGLRINPSIEAGFHPHVMAGVAGSKFGVQVEQYDDAVRVAERCGLTIDGVHAHLGSDVLDPRHHIELLELLVGIARDSPGIGWVNIGGGFGTPRASGDQEFDWDALGDAATHLLRSAQGQPLELRLEPGGYLLMDTGVLLTRVVGVRASSDARAATAVVDANTNHVVSVLLYQARHPARLVTALRGRSGRRQRLVGQLMQAADVLDDEVMLPDLAEGDLVTLGHVGAYAASRATTFNGRPRPAEVLIRDGVARCIRRAETVDDLLIRDVREP